jgi:predicted transposase YbfD/YdcC
MGEKFFKIAADPVPMRLIDLKMAIVTIDAMGTQRKIVWQFAQ